MNFKYYDKLEIQNLLKSNNISFQKKFGQNFIIGEDMVKNAIDSMNLSPQDTVLEIGCGIGSVTAKLLDTGCKVIGFEIDYKFIDILRSFFGDNDRFSLITGDFLKTFPRMIKSLSECGQVKIFGSLPYYITTPIIEKILTSRLDFSGAYFIVQRELESRIFAQPATEHYGLFSLLINAFTTPEMLYEIPRELFFPAPNVDSMLVSLTARHVDMVNKQAFVDLAKVIFLSRRKKLINNLISSGRYASISKDTFLDIFESLNIPFDIRGEALSIDDITSLANTIYSKYIK